MHLPLNAQSLGHNSSPISSTEISFSSLLPLTEADKFSAAKFPHSFINKATLPVAKERSSVNCCENKSTVTIIERIVFFLKNHTHTLAPIWSNILWLWCIFTGCEDNSYLNIGWTYINQCLHIYSNFRTKFTNFCLRYSLSTVTGGVFLGNFSSLHCPSEAWSQLGSLFK